jgi:hypothetical protein
MRRKGNNGAALRGFAADFCALRAVLLARGSVEQRLEMRYG